MPSVSELQKVDDKRRSLASRVRDLNKDNGLLAQRVEQMAVGRQTPMRRLLGAGISNTSAYLLSGHLYTAMMKRGWMPGWPLDSLFGLAGEVGTSFSNHWAGTMSHDLFRGMTDGGLARTGAFQRLDRSEVGGRVCLLMPAKRRNNKGANNQGTKKAA